MKKFITLLLVLTGMVCTASAQTWTLKGDFDSWGDGQNFSAGTTSLSLTAGEVISFKVVKDGSTWYGATDTGYNFDWTVSSTTAFSTDGGARNFMLFAHLTGTYTFSLTTSDGAPTNLSISSPSGSYEKTTVYFCNTLSWATPYFYIRTNAYYDGSKGAGSNQCPNGMAMSKIGETNIWKAEFPTVFLDADIAFLDRKQDSYDNFYNAKASVRGDFSTSKPVFVPNTTSNDTKNGTTYYSNGEWYSYSAPATSYSRTGLTKGNFGTICLPYAATVEGATVYKIVSTVGSGDGLTGINLESVDALEAGKAYIFKATGTTLTATYSSSFTEATDANGMLGTFTDSKAPVGSYVLSENTIHKVTGGDVNVGANKAWITLTGIDPAARGLDFIAFEGSGTTGIETVKANQAQNDEYFNLAGQRVAQPTKGLYIVNGKKVIIK